MMFVEAVEANWQLMATSAARQEELELWLDGLGVLRYVRGIHDSIIVTVIEPGQALTEGL